MQKLVFFLFLSVICLARDNPFRPVGNAGHSTPVKAKKSSFKDANFRLPDSARVLKNIEIYYQNIDGSIKKKSIHIDKSIDWHDQFEIGIKPKKIKLVEPKKNILKIEPNITTKSEYTKKIKSTNKLKPTNALKSTNIQKFQFKNFISFEIVGKTLKIITKDKLIRNFLVTKPYKVVFDFKRDINFFTKTLKTNSIPYTAITLGNHEKYYRVAVKLDGQYGYNLKKAEGNFTITLK